MTRFTLAVWFFLCPCALVRADATIRAWGLINPKDDYAAQLDNQKCVLDLLEKGLSVYWLVEPHAALPELRPGDYVIPRQNNDAFAEIVLREIAVKQKVSVAEAGNLRVIPLRQPKILCGVNSFYDWYYNALRKCSFIFDTDRGTPLAGYNLFLAPGGSGPTPEAWIKKLQAFMKDGNGYIGSCHGACQAMYTNRPFYEGASLGAGLIEADSATEAKAGCPLKGIGTIVLKNHLPKHPVLWHLPAEFKSHYHNGPVMKPRDDTVQPLTLLEDSLFSKVPEHHGKPMWVAGQRPGEGRLVIFGDHPEADPSKTNPTADIGHRALYDAIFWCTAGPERDLTLPAPPPVSRPWHTPAKDKAPDVAARVEQLKEKLGAIKPKNAKTSKDLAAIVLILDTMKAMTTHDAERRLLGGRETLLAEAEKCALAHAGKSMPYHAFTALSLRLESWRRDYERFTNGLK